MSVGTWFSVLCDECGTVAGGVQDMQDSAKTARRHAREQLGWARRDDPQTGKVVDLCNRCRAMAKYHVQSAMNVAAQLQLFDREIARYPAGSAEGSYWAFLRAKFIDALAMRPQPFSDFKPQFDEEFS